MPERDEWWSTYLHRSLGTESPVDRLVGWATRISTEDVVDECTTNLCAVVLAWMFTASNRFLRDRATKALVSLLTGRLAATERLLDCFGDVNDPYVSERLYAAAYGVAMRSHDACGVGKLAAGVYDRVFASGSPPAHILLRDYARGVVERAVALGSQQSFDRRLFMPPYTSEWPDIPDESTIKGLEAESKQIYFSVMGGDFGRYVIGSRSSSWLSFRIDEDAWASVDERLANLLYQLNESERDQWECFCANNARLIELERLGVCESLRKQFGDLDIDIDALFDRDITKLPRKDFNGAHDVELVKLERDTSLDHLRSSLRRDRRIELDELLNEGWPQHQGRDAYLDLSLVKKYVLWRVFHLGWTADRFGDFDGHLNRIHYTRTASKPERIGKKYQWIAYHEILAHISDHYQYRHRYGSDVNQKYDGPWQLSLRDIDPSCTFPSIQDNVSSKNDGRSWWCPFAYDEWCEHLDHGEWMTRDVDIPDVADLLRVSKPNEKSAWLNLSGYFSWRQPHSPDRESSDVETREFWLICTGYFVRENDLGAFMDWAGTRNFMGRWMPDPLSIMSNGGAFLGEYRWSPAYRYVNDPCYGREEWVKPERECPVSVRLATVEYDGGAHDLDCSLRQSYTLRLPDHNLVEKLGLRWSGRGADFIDGSGELLAFDPTAHEVGPPGALIRQEVLEDYLTTQGLGLCWTIVGEKQVLGTSSDRRYHGSLIMSGAYAFTDSGLIGDLRWFFNSPLSDTPGSEAEPWN